MLMPLSATASESASSRSSSRAQRSLPPRSSSAARGRRPRSGSGGRVAAKASMIVPRAHAARPGVRRRRGGAAGGRSFFPAMDDASSLGFARLYPDETADSALAFLEACERFYGEHGIRLERVLTDNGTCFKRRWAEGCDLLGIAVRKTRPYRPQTNGKVERF